MYEVDDPLTTWVAVTVEALAPAGALPVIHATWASGVAVEFCDPPVSSKRY